MSTTAERVFRKNYAKLVEAIDSPTQFANDFYQEGLISESTKDAASEVGNTRLKQDKAVQLITAVQTKVKVDPKALPKVIRVLRRHDASELADKMAAQGSL